MSEWANEWMNQWIPYKMMVKLQIENAKNVPCFFASVCSFAHFLWSFSIFQEQQSLSISSVWNVKLTEIEPKLPDQERKWLGEGEAATMNLPVQIST